MLKKQTPATKSLIESIIFVDDYPWKECSGNLCVRFRLIPNYHKARPVTAKTWHAAPYWKTGMVNILENWHGKYTQQTSKTQADATFVDLMQWWRWGGVKICHSMAPLHVDVKGFCPCIFVCSYYYPLNVFCLLSTLSVIRLLHLVLKSQPRGKKSHFSITLVRTIPF